MTGLHGSTQDKSASIRDNRQFNVPETTRPHDSMTCKLQYVLKRDFHALILYLKQIISNPG